MPAAVKEARAPKAKAETGAKAPKTPKPASFSKEQELSADRDMLLIRRFEERAGQLYGMGLIGVSATSISARKRWSWACRPRSRTAIR